MTKIKISIPNSHIPFFSAIRLFRNLHGLCPFCPFGSHHYCRVYLLLRHKTFLCYVHLLIMRAVPHHVIVTVVKVTESIVANFLHLNLLLIDAKVKNIHFLIIVLPDIIIKYVCHFLVNLLFF